MVKDELGVWDGLLRLLSLMTELMDGTRWMEHGYGREAGVGGRADGLWWMRKRGTKVKARCRGCRRRKVENSLW